MNKIKRIWFKSLGNKASDCDRESDLVGIIRTVIFATYFITNIFIIYGVSKTHIFSNKTFCSCCPEQK